MNFFEQKKIKKGKNDQQFNTETMLPVSEIHHDTIILKDGGLRGIIKVEGINIDLKNDDEIGMTIEQYKKFLNGLDFPVQILVRNRGIDLTEYLAYMQGNVAKIDHPTLRTQADAYMKFLDAVQIKGSMIFVKDFYVVVPYYSALTGDEDGVKTPRWMKLLRVFDSKDGAEKIIARYRSFLKNKKTLDNRCMTIIESMQALGTTAKRLGAMDIVSVLFHQYNPTVQQMQSRKDGEYSAL